LRRLGHVRREQGATTMTSKEPDIAAFELAANIFKLAEGYPGEVFLAAVAYVLNGISKRRLREIYGDEEP
jgi:hypothetical protein